jgi:hypothetical protein
MTAKCLVSAIALLLSATSATLAQSAYTTGTVASNEAAGYPAPYANGRLYSYAPALPAHSLKAGGRDPRFSRNRRGAVD